MEGPIGAIGGMHGRLMTECCEQEEPEGQRSLLLPQKRARQPETVLCRAPRGQLYPPDPRTLAGPWAHLPVSSVSKAEAVTVLMLLKAGPNLRALGSSSSEMTYLRAFRRGGARQLQTQG
jgi:hypothetical protein